MTLTTRLFAGFMLAASAAVLGAAFAAQYWGGFLPCELCLWERWPWQAAITISIVALIAGGTRQTGRPALPWVALALGLVFAAGAGLAFYHVGVERHWFAGPSACTAGGAHAGSVAEMKALILRAQPVQCDQPAWTLWRVSLAGWNLLASVALLGCCLGAGLRRLAPRRAGGRRGVA